MFGTPESGCALLFMTRLARVFAKGTVLKHGSLPKRHAVWIGLVAAGWLAGLCASAADFTVTSPGFFFSINGQSDPKITLKAGQTYTFSINTTCNFHPFEILGAPAGSLSTNNICSGIITFTVPAKGGNFNYICSIHGFGNAITGVTPPPARIVNFSVGTNIVVASTGTNGFTITPEYTTNVLSTNWFALTVVTNRLVGGTNTPGTNETICGRPPGDNIFIRIRTQ
jgi:hypothetical protein